MYIPIVDDLRSSQPPSTSITLVGRLRDPADAEAWREFDHRYRDLLTRFLRSRGLQLADAEDTAQSVLTKLVTGLRSFEYDPAKAGFRAYLYRCLRSGLSDFAARQERDRKAVIHQSGQSSHNHRESDLSQDPVYKDFEREWVDHHYRLAVARYRAGADPSAIWMLEATLSGTPPRIIAEERGMTENAVHKAQQRLRDRLRALIDEQLRDEEANHERPAR